MEREKLANSSFTVPTESPLSSTRQEGREVGVQARILPLSNRASPATLPQAQLRPTQVGKKEGGRQAAGFRKVESDFH